MFKYNYNYGNNTESEHEEDPVMAILSREGIKDDMPVPIMDKLDDVLGLKTKKNTDTMIPLAFTGQPYDSKSDSLVLYMPLT